MDKKILILTLGTGKNQNLGDEFNANKMQADEKQAKLKEIFDSDKFAYQNVEYVMTDENGNELFTEKSEFVAKPLIRRERPDIIFIVGTVKSVWSSFYSKFARKTVNSEGGRNFDSYKELYDIESCADYGFRTEWETLKPIETKIEEIYQKDGIFEDVIEKKMEVHILLTRYGLDRKQLEDNYGIISSMTEHLRSGIEYSVSFDITHSFRSLPLYNLIVLNYLQHTTQYRVKISHVYYGNVEVLRETGKRGYIVDLKDLIHVLDLTNGVGEFRNTGNSVALQKELKDDQTGLRNVLETFDWATQLNDYQTIIDSLTDMLYMLSADEKKENKSPYADLSEMLNRVLSQEFISQDRLLQMADIESHPRYFGELQVCITKWYQNQNRYGLAIATGLEALRSLLVPLWLESQNPGKPESECVTLEACGKENNRKCAEGMLDGLRKNVEYGRIQDDSEMMQLLVNLSKVKEKAKPIRNRFAHNLMSTQTAGTSEQKMSSSEEKKVIDKYIKYLVLLCEALRESEKPDGAARREEVKRAYCSKPMVRERQKIRGESIRMVISREKDYSAWPDYRHSNTRSYDVYVLPGFLLQKVQSKNGKNTKKYETVVEDAFLVAHYMDQMFDVSEVTVILRDDIGFLQKVCFPPIFKRFGIKSVQLDNKNLPDYELKIEDFEEEKAKTKEKYDLEFPSVRACRLPD